MPRLRQVDRDEAMADDGHGIVAAMYRLMFGDRPGVEQYGFIAGLGQSEREHPALVEDLRGAGPRRRHPARDDPPRGNGVCVAGNACSQA